MTKTDLTPAARLLEQFGQDSRDWDDTVAKWKLEALLLGVMSELAEVIGKQETKLCTGVIAHDITEWVEAWKPERPWDEDTREMEAWFPNSYDVIVVTDKLIVNAWGSISRELDAVRPEATQIMAIKNAGGLSTRTRPGDVRGDGIVATHHDISVTFADENSIDLPAGEEVLTPAGTGKMTELVLYFYERLSE